MNKSVMYAVTAALSLAATNSSVAAPPDFSMPKFTTFTSLGVLQADEKDLDPEAFEIEVGFKGAIKVDSFKALYALNVDVSKAVNAKDTHGTAGESDIHVKEAKIVIPSKYGTFVLAPRSASKHLSEMYSNIDIFEYNETHASDTPTGMPIFGQASEGQDVIGYSTPEFKNFKISAAMLSLYEDNNNDVDVKSFRIIYDDKKMHIGAGIVISDESVANAAEDYKRSSLTAGYKFSKLDIGTTYEMNEDTFGTAGDYDSLGVTARYHFDDGLSFAAGYFDKDSEIDANDNQGTVLQLKKEFSPNFEAWAETGQYDNSADNVALGLNIKF